ncbi:MAG: VanZ family protein [Lachnospiraceae bacterium]|nr:VanZ family protein [Lachnospiraceae bacterium]
METEVFTILTVLWFGAMCIFTFQLGEQTVRVSGSLTRIVESVIGIAFYTDAELLEKRLRFLAHPVEFAVLTILCLLTFSNFKTGTRGAIITVGVLIVWSVVSEVLKRNIPGRHCNGIDMVGNMIGVGIGVLISVLAAMI